MTTNFTHIIGEFASVSLAGICKNAGKTTVLTKIIKDFDRQETVLGITSIGRDGEAVDVVTGTKKPGIYVRKGTIIATAAGLISACDITKEILAKTEIATPLGEIVFVRALSDGNVQIAGPSMNRQLTRIQQDFTGFGAEKVLIDGAISRKSLCSPEVAESIILCSGASFDKNMDTVISHTKYMADILGLDTLRNAGIRDSILQNQDFNMQDGNQNYNRQNGVNGKSRNLNTGEPNNYYKFLLFSKQGDSMMLPAGESLSDALRTGKYGDTEYIYVNGALSDMMIKPLLMSDVSLQSIQFIVKDGSSIMLDREGYGKLVRKGASICVLQPIHLLAITVNPFSAYGYDFNKQEFEEKMSDAVAKVPVINVMEIEAQ